MKKTLTIILDILVPLGALLMAIAIFLPAYTKGSGTSMTTTQMYDLTSLYLLGGAILLYILLPVSVTLFYSKKETLSNIALAILVGTGIFFIVLFVKTKAIYDKDTTINYGAGAFLGLVGAILSFLSLALRLILIPVSKENNEDKTIEALIRYKDLLTKGIITENEFLSKREELLGEKKKESKK